ncbi:MAG: hypothetical protein JJT94_17630 [Bernardetiaceae bacterium]|nr:hypothetical protein [Bernardetiaceae bacterium]
MNRFFVIFGVVFCCLLLCSTTSSFANVGSEGEKEPKEKKTTTETVGIYEGTTVTGGIVGMLCEGQAGACYSTESGADAKGTYIKFTTYLRGDKNIPLPPITVRNSANPGSLVPTPVPVQQGSLVIWTYSGISID